MTTWDEVYAPLGAPRELSAAPARTGRRGSWGMTAAAGVAAALIAAALLARYLAPPRIEPPIPIAKVERSAPAIAPRLALRPSAPPPIAEAPAPLVPETVEPEVKIVRRSPPIGGPLIIDVAEELAKLRHAAPATR